MQETQAQSLGQEDPLEKEMGNPLQYSCLEDPMDRRAWQAAYHGVAKSRTRLSDFTFSCGLVVGMQRNRRIHIFAVILHRMCPSRELSFPEC